MSNSVYMQNNNNNNINDKTAIVIYILNYDIKITENNIVVVPKSFNPSITSGNIYPVLLYYSNWPPGRLLK